MTSKELIAKLKTLPPDTRIFTHGYEGGYCDVDDFEEVEIFCLNSMPEETWYGGHNVECDTTCEHKKVKGIIL